MMRKIFQLIFVVGPTLLLFACEQKELPEIFQSLKMLYATPEKGHLPLKMFLENDSLFVQYIKNGKPLDKIHLAYNHKKKQSLFYFHEVIDGKKTGGTYIISDDLYDTFDFYSGHTFIYRDKSKNEIYYSVICSFSDIEIIFRSHNLPNIENELVKMQMDGEWDMSKEAQYQDYTPWHDRDYIKNLAYLIYSDPRTIDYSFAVLSDMCDLEISTSSDGNIRIYNQMYYLGGNGHGSMPQMEMVQYRSGNNVYANVDGIVWWESITQGNFPVTTDIRIYTLRLNDKTYYLIDRAIYDYMSSPSNCDLLQLYLIDNGELIRQNLFNTGKKIVEEIAVDYDDRDDWRYDRKKGNDWNLFKYDAQDKIINVPLVKGTTLTDKYLQYQWDGKHFTYSGIK